MEEPRLEAGAAWSVVRDTQADVSNVTQVLIDGLGELLHPTTQVWGAHDSGAYQDIPPFDR